MGCCCVKIVALRGLVYIKRRIIEWRELRKDRMVQHGLRWRNVTDEQESRVTVAVRLLPSVIDAVDDVVQQNPVQYRNRSTFIEQAMQEKLERETT